MTNVDEVSEIRMISLFTLVCIANFFFSKNVVEWEFYGVVLFSDICCRLIFRHHHGS